MGVPITTCIACGVDIPLGQSRCKACETDRSRDYDAHWRGVAKAAIAHHLATVGPVCPGWNRPRHDVDPSDLTADHRIPLDAGGTRDPSNVAVLCRACNGAKGGRRRGPTPRPRYRPRGQPLGIRIIDSTGASVVPNQEKRNA